MQGQGHRVAGKWPGQSHPDGSEPGGGSVRTEPDHVAAGSETDMRSLPARSWDVPARTINVTLQRLKPQYLLLPLHPQKLKGTNTLRLCLHVNTVLVWVSTETSPFVNRSHPGAIFCVREGGRGEGTGTGATGSPRCRQQFPSGPHTRRKCLFPSLHWSGRQGANCRIIGAAFTICTCDSRPRRGGSAVLEGARPP